MKFWVDRNELSIVLNADLNGIAGFILGGSAYVNLFFVKVNLSCIPEFGNRPTPIIKTAFGYITRVPD